MLVLALAFDNASNWYCFRLSIVLRSSKFNHRLPSVIHKTVGLLMVEMLYCPNLILVYLVLHTISQIWQYARKEVSPALAISDMSVALTKIHTKI